MGNTAIKIEVGDLAGAKVDVIVNTIGTEANLKAGSVSYAILEGGGQSLQKDITELHPTGLKIGEIAQTNGGNLQCKKVFHVVLRQWMNVDDEAEKLLYRVITKCLKWASDQKFTSIAFPALGAGFHRFPGYRSADIMFRAIESFESDRWFKSLKIVHIFLHQRDDLNLKDFTARQGGIDVNHENYLTKTVVLKKIDAPKDVLVNTTQIDLNLSVGAVSRSLLMKGGQTLQTQCKEKCPRGLDFGGMVQTQGGNLMCKKVFHVVVPMWNQGKGQSEQGFQAVMMKCLQEASKQKFRSIGFPVLGTGYLQYPVKTSSSLMLETILKFMEENPTRSVQSVTIIIAHKDYGVRKIIEKYFDGKGEDESLVPFMSGEPEFLPREKDALAEGKIVYFPLIPGCFRSKSPEESHFNKVTEHFFKSLEKDDVNRHIYKVTKVEYVVNPNLQKKFRAAQSKMSDKQANYGEPVLAYHGTPEKHIRSICEEGFLRPGECDYVMETDTGWYGNGIYLSGSPRFSMNYMQMSQMLLLCKVLQGKVYQCPKKKQGAEKELGYDSHVDPFGKEIVIYDSDCILPCYIIYFDICERFKRSDDKYDPQENDRNLYDYLAEMEMGKGTKIPDN